MQLPFLCTEGHGLMLLSHLFKVEEHVYSLSCISQTGSVMDLQFGVNCEQQYATAGIIKGEFWI